MTTQPEARISRGILDALKSAGVFSFKVHGGPTMMAGLPDIIACVEGIFLGLEVKTPQKRSNTSERQKYVHGLIGQAGGIVHVVCSVPEALEIVYRIRAHARESGLSKNHWNR